jgi:hypothetical protein
MTAGELVDLEAALHEAASDAVGYDDFGDDDYREGLGRVVADLERATGGGEALREAAHYSAHGPLVGRLYSERGWKERPDALATELRSPVVILGIPRTGTTMMHKFLAMHDGFQVLERWIVPNPMVRPPRDAWPRVPEYRAAAAEVDALPQHRRITHYVAADEADECLVLVNQAFVSVMFGVRHSLPRYDDWMLAQDWTPALRRHADNLRLIGADEPQRRWLLKNPSHVLAANGLFAVFPDAKVVWTHRDPQEAIGSLVHVLCNSSAGDPRQRAVRELRLWSEGVRRTEEARAEHPDAFFDVDYRTLTTDPLAVATALFDWLGMDVMSGTETQMRTWLAENPQGKHGVHEYDPAVLGVTDEAVRRAFAPYMARYGLG